MFTPTGTKYIVRDPDVYGGKPCIEGHRISVHDVAVWYQQGQSPDAIAQGFQLTLSQVHAALSYYYDRQDEIDREINAEAAEIAACARADNSPLARRIRAAIAEQRA